MVLLVAGRSRGGISLKRIVAMLIVAAAAVSGAVAGSFDDGVAAYDRGDYPTALKLWRPLAEQGNAVAQTDLYEAQHALGFMYEWARRRIWFKHTCGLAWRPPTVTRRPPGTAPAWPS